MSKNVEVRVKIFIWGKSRGHAVWGRASILDEWRINWLNWRSIGSMMIYCCSTYPTPIGLQFRSLDHHYKAWGHARPHTNSRRPNRPGANHFLYMSPCNMPICPVWKPNGWGWWFVQDLRVINKIALSLFPSCSKPKHLFLTGSTRLKMVHCCGPLFGLFQHPCRYIFAIAWNSKQYTWTVKPQGFTEALSNLPNCSTEI